MKNYFAALIAAGFVLTAPCLNATAGYSFHFPSFDMDKWVQQKSINLGRFISDHVPEAQRASVQNRNDLYKIIAATDIQRPVILYKVDTAPEGNKDLAETVNRRFFSHIKLYEKKLTADERLHVLGHETIHVANQDSLDENNSKKNMTNAGTLFKIASGAHIGALLMKSPLVPYTRALAAFSCAAALYTLSKLPNRSNEESIALQRQREFLAEEGAYSLRASTFHDIKGLNRDLTLVERLEEKYGRDYRRRGELYPTLGEEKLMIKSALNKAHRPTH